MLAKDLEERVARRSRQAIGLVGVAALGLGIWGFTTRVVGEHVTDCGFEGQGRVYAKVRVNNLLGGVHDQTVRVDFNFRDEYYDSGVATAHVAAHGHGTTVVRERFPPYGPFTDPTPEGLHCSIVDVEY